MSVTNLSRPTREDILAILNYNPETGVFTWRVKKSIRTKIGDVAGTINCEGYCRIEIDNKQHGAHRLAWLLTHGEWPNGEIDHINGKTGDNRIENLRCVSKEQNQQNRKLNRNNKSGYIGVYSQFGKWKAAIRTDGRQVHLGTFATCEEAANAYLVAKSRFHKLTPVPREPARGVAA